MQIMAPVPPPDPSIPLPPIHLRIHPIGEEGAIHFLQTFGPKSAEILASHCRYIIAALYPSTSDPSFPTIHTITLYIRPVDGVAYTTENMIDPKAKEIHFNTNYIKQCTFHEISGVLIHELVHVWQRDGEGSTPGGFIEGLADYVRLKSGLGAAHWHKSKPQTNQTWDAGYERTGWFLEWVEDHAKDGKGWVKRVNTRLGKEKWGDWVWKEAGAEGVEELWKGYLKSFEQKETKEGSGPPPAAPTHGA